MHRRRDVVRGLRPASEILTRVFFPQIPEVGPLSKDPQH